MLNFSTGLTTGNSFRDEVESVQGQELLSESFPSGANAPTDIVVRDLLKVEARAQRACSRCPAWSRVEPGGSSSDTILLKAVLEPEPYSEEAYALIEDDPRRGQARRRRGDARRRRRRPSRPTCARPPSATRS